MEKGQIIYFYFDSVIPCQKGCIKDIITGGYEVNWLNENAKPVGSSSVPNDRVFATKEECISYNELIRNNKKNKLREQLSTKKDVLSYMYSSIYSEDYDWSAEKEVIKEKIKELFGIDLTH